ncbi:MAG: amino acid adenylation domain-containing protein [Cyanobacteria bacterium P01_F01_bin.150]
MQDCFETLDSSLETMGSDLEENVFLLPLSFAQQRMWFMERLQPEKCLYNLSFPTRLEGVVNITALEQSFNAIMQRHETLRTTFTVVEGQPMQVIAQSQRIELPVIDLRQISQVEQTARVDELIKEDAQQAFDLSSGPLLRVGLIQLEDTKSILLFTAHHIVFDGWSIGVFLKELEGFYDAFCHGQSFNPPDLPIQYGDFAVWQRDRLQGETLETHASYWREKLSGTLPILELPCDRIRPKIQTYTGAAELFSLPKPLSQALVDLAQREGSTLFMVLLTAFNILLYRYSGQEDLLVGTPIANRNQSEIEGLIGVFINTLVLRNDLSGNPTFRELLAQVRQTTLEAYTHQDFPFEKMIEELKLDRDLGQSPLFQVMLVLQNQPMDDLTLSNLSLSSVEVENPISQFDLTLSLVEAEEGLLGRLEYSTDLFDKSTIVRIWGHFQTLLESIVDNPNLAIAQVPFIPQPEWQQLTQEWSNSQSCLPLDSKTVYQLFESQVEQNPESTAAIFEHQPLSYQQLNQRSNEVADFLKKLGVRPGVLVGICMERSLDMLAGLLGILKAGGAYVPLDPSHPSERLQLILEDAQLTYVLTQTPLIPTLKSHQEQTNRLLIDIHNISDETYGETLLASRLNTHIDAERSLSDDLAYVIYTSGSTGKPKGVQVTHHSVANFLTSMQGKLSVKGDETFLAITTIAFDISILEIFLPLVTGSTVVIANSEDARNGAKITEMLTQFNVNIMQATPTTWQMLLASGWQGIPNFKVLCGGEALSKETAVQLLEQNVELWNMYGPTETTIWSTLCQIENDFQTISIGRPIDNTEVYILDSHLNPLPVGVPGELLIGGDGLAKGYLNRPELTADKFIPHPFAAESNSKLYKTGDLVRYLPNGMIEYIGRSDSQVKIRGYRIELGEIESAIQQHPAVEKAVVMANEYGINDKRLIAYIVIAKSDSIGAAQNDPWESQLQQHLKERLPNYMIPTEWAVLDAFPSTPNGKIDRKSLPKLGELRPKDIKVQEPPKTDLEKSIANIWEKALKRGQIDVQDSFFDLGGHSLLLIQVHDSLSTDLNIDVDLLDLFKYPTVRTLANHLSDKPSQLLQVSVGDERAKKRQAARNRRSKVQDRLKIS